MARTANRHRGGKAAPTRWNLGMYIRLSKEDTHDLHSGTRDSNSVANQRLLLLEYYRSHSDEFCSAVFYIDDGFSGTDLSRDAFQRLLADIERGEVNCVVVKDLSRLARNYAEAGRLIDDYFVRRSVRFICLGEPVIDSYRDPGSVSSIAVPIYNLFNDFYARQTSEKVRQVLDMKRRGGHFIGAFAPYGYRKDPDEKGRLLVDPEAAETVRLIFRLFCEGYSKSGIAKQLNQWGIPSPSAYKQLHGSPYRCPKSDHLAVQGLWSVSTVHKMLSNAVYTGAMVQGRQRVHSYKVHTAENVPREDWFVVPGTHAPIVDAALFQRVQTLLQRDTRTPPGAARVHLFSGFLRCADCGAAMMRHTYRSGGAAVVDYHCRTYATKHRSACTRHGIRHTVLESAVLAVLRLLLDLLVDSGGILAQVRGVPVVSRATPSGEALIRIREAELQQLQRYRQGLYQEKLDGALSVEEYTAMLRDYDARCRAARQAIEALRSAPPSREQEANPSASPWDMDGAHLTLRAMDREILAALVDAIQVEEGGGIAITLRFGDPFP